MKILLIDDHNLFREGLELLLKRLVQGVDIVHAVTVDIGIAQLLKKPRPDLVFTDLSLPGVSDIEALLSVRKHAPDVPSVVIAASEEAATVWRAIDAGAAGYIFKSTDSQELSRALNIVVNGGVYLPTLALSSEQDFFVASDTAELTQRQSEVLRWVVRGMANKQIAEELHISSETVKTHLRSIYEVLGVNSRTEAVYAVASSGLLMS